MHKLLLLFTLLAHFSYSQTPRFEIIVLGHIQDAGSPHIGCERDCCKLLSPEEKEARLVSSLGIIDHDRSIGWILDATPDFPQQWELLKEAGADSLGGIFLTHAHIGHYTGLMYLGREALGSRNVPVFAMPRMQVFLENNGPWSQLVKLGNVKIHTLQHMVAVQLAPDLSITPLKVPHRDEYSETVGFQISSLEHSAIFIPDINKWQLWEESIVDYTRAVDYAFLDGSFYSPQEIGYRPIEEIPHPTVQETMKALDVLTPAEKSRVYFIHMNHTNPILNRNSPEFRSISPFREVEFLQRFSL